LVAGGGKGNDCSIIDFEVSEKNMDWVLSTIALLMTATLAAFFLELTPYPVGAALLAVLFFFRLKKMNSRRR
jgi:hypothetical protein